MVSRPSTFSHTQYHTHTNAYAHIHTHSRTLKRTYTHVQLVRESQMKNIQVTFDCLKAF